MTHAEQIFYIFLTFVVILSCTLDVGITQFDVFILPVRR